MKRRTFFEYVLQLLGGWIAFGGKQIANAQTRGQKRDRFNFPLQGRRVPLMQGATNNTSTQILVMLPYTAVWRYEALDSKNIPLKIKIESRSQYPNSRYAIERIQISGIQNVSENYKLRIFNQDQVLIDTRTFKGLDVSKPNPRIAFMSCMESANSIQKEMWASVIAQAPDMMFFIGDCVYADGEDVPVDAGAIWQRYVETRLELDIFQTEKLIPTIAIWDDHDFGLDDADGRFELKNETLSIFKSFFGNVDTAELQNGPGVSIYFKAFGQRFALFDGRFFLNLPDEKGRPSHWGSEQKSWIFSKIDPKSAEPVWIVNGIQFFGGYRQEFESLERDFPSELNELMATLKNLNAPAVLVSGDVHYTEIMELEERILGYPSVEITSSSIHSIQEPEYSMMGRNSRRVFATPSFNYVIAKIDAIRTSLNFRLEVLGPIGRSFHSSNHVVKKGN